MCGIAGYISTSRLDHEQQIKSMTNALAHRGPDSEGFYITNSNGKTITLGHRRLSILDTSDAGNQPMHYKNFNLIFNGEIYNFKSIRNDLISLGHEFKSNSDTEMLLHAFEEWGVDCIGKFRGMFAFVLLDSKKDLVYIFRDRAGVKPLYYWHTEDHLVFASEIKAIKAYKPFNSILNMDAVSQFFSYGYIMSPNSIYENVKKLESGSFLTYNLKNHETGITKYWDVLTFYNQPIKNISYEQAKDELEEILIESCKLRMVSDVPVGVFLSGGYDSSLVSGVLAKEYSETINTFTIGFADEHYNEAKYAKEISKYLGTKHHEYYCTEEEAKQFFPKIAYYYDEPFADVSSIPTMLLSHITKQHVTVALSADAGDETFAGYDKHRRILEYLNKYKKFESIPFSSVGLNLISKSLPSSKQRLKHNLNGLSNLFNDRNFNGIGLLNLLSKKQNKEYLNQLFKFDFIDTVSAFNLLPKDFIKSTDSLNQVLAVDYLTYLTDDILVKVDRATMSASLEGREPLLDHKIIEYVANLPSSYKFDGVSQKRILKDITHKYVPKNLVDRPKQGFTLPIFNWLQNDLKETTEHYLSDSFIEKQNLFNPNFVRKVKSEFFKDNHSYKDLTWYLVVFNQWYETNFA